MLFPKAGSLYLVVENQSSEVTFDFSKAVTLVVLQERKCFDLDLYRIPMSSPHLRVFDLLVLCRGVTICTFLFTQAAGSMDGNDTISGIDVFSKTITAKAVKEKLLIVISAGRNVDCAAKEKVKRKYLQMAID